MHTPNSELVAGITAQAPEVARVYDAKAGQYYDPVCSTPPAPAYMPLPGTPSPFALKTGK